MGNNANMESETEICIGKAYKLGEEKNLVDIRLGKFSVAAMLDCGASISCLSLDMYKRSGLAKEYDMEQSDVHAAQTVDGSHMKILGKTRMMFIKHYAPNRCLCIKVAKSTMCN